MYASAGGGLPLLCLSRQTGCNAGLSCGSTQFSPSVMTAGDRHIGKSCRATCSTRYGSITAAIAGDQNPYAGWQVRNGRPGGKKGFGGNLGSIYDTLRPSSGKLPFCAKSTGACSCSWPAKVGNREQRPRDRNTSLSQVPRYTNLAHGQRRRPPTPPPPRSTPVFGLPSH